MNAIEFLKSWCGDTGPFSVGAIDPDDTSSKGHDWLTTRDLSEVERFVEANSGKRNLYLQVNLCRPDLGTMRAHRHNVAVAVCVHAEIDPPKTVDTSEKLEAWQLEKGEELISDDYWLGIGLPRPTAFVFSGTGYVVMWRLEEPVVLWRGEPLAQDPFLVDAIESRNRALVDKLGADSASTDVSRLLRLPGTYNIPGESKKKKGRTEAVLAELVEYDPERRVPLALMPAGAAQIANADVEIPEFEGAPPPESLEAAAQALGKAWPDAGDGRHQAHLALSGSLARIGWPVELIASFAARVAEVQEPGNANMEKRVKAAETSVAKVHAGQIITGWPSLIEHVGEEVVAEVRQILNLPLPVEHDPEFREALVQVDADSAPTRDKVRSALESTAAKLKRKTKEDAKYHGKLLGKVLRGEELVREDENPVKALCEAALLVVRNVPQGTSDEQIAEVMLGCASIMGLKPRLGEIIQGAKKHLEKLRVADVARRPPDEFRLEDSGPRAGMPVAKCERNIRVGLNKLGVSFRYNLFTNKKLIMRDDVEEVYQDHHTEQLLNEFERTFDIIVEEPYFRRTCNVIARENSFHPVRDYLDSLPTEIPDEYADLAETWLIRYAGAEDSPYVRAVSRLMLVAAVRRIRQPGCLFQEMLILETPEQGKGKSEGLRALVPDELWFTDNFTLHDDAKKMLEQTIGKWIIEAAELKGFLRMSDDSVKQYLSRRADEARMAYGHEPLHKLREFVIFGTINDLEYLKDLTGNRRYWPMRIVQFDVKGIIEVRDMLWAVASRLEQEHPEPEYIRLDPSLYAAATAEQEKRRMIGSVELRLRDALEDVTGAFQIQEVYPIAGYEDRDPSKAQQQEIVSVLQAIGFIRERLTIGGKQRWYYVRGSTPEQRRVRVNISGSKIAGFTVKMSQDVSTPVSTSPQGPEAPAN